MSVRVLAIEHEDGTGPAYVGACLRTNGIDLHVARPYAGDELPADLTGYHGLLVLGGTPGPHDDAVAPWLPQVRELMRYALEADLPLLGICLGGELLASVAGGKVDRIAGPPEIGLHRLQLTAEGRSDVLFRSLPADVPAVEWHWEEIVELPPDAVALCGNTRFPYQAFRVGNRAWGTQFHPEVLTKDAARWAQNGAAEIGNAGLDPEAVTAEIAVAEPELRHVWAVMTRQWAQIVAGTEAATAGAS